MPAVATLLTPYLPSTRLSLHPPTWSLSTPSGTLHNPHTRVSRTSSNPLSQPPLAQQGKGA